MPHWGYWWRHNGNLLLWPSTDTNKMPQYVALVQKFCAGLVAFNLDLSHWLSITGELKSRNTHWQKVSQCDKSRFVQKIIWKHTDGQTNATNRFNLPANVVDNEKCSDSWRRQDGSIRATTWIDKGGAMGRVIYWHQNRQSVPTKNSRSKVETLTIK